MSDDCWCSAPVSVILGRSSESKGQSSLFRVTRDMVTLEQALWGRKAQTEGCEHQGLMSRIGLGFGDTARREGHMVSLHCLQICSVRQNISMSEEWGSERPRNKLRFVQLVCGH